MMMVRRARLLLPPLIAMLALLLTVSSSPSPSASSGEITLTRAHSQSDQSLSIGGVKLSKLFDFSQYKQSYGKKYTDAVQELARMRLYLGSVLRVIIAAFKHRFFGKSYYLAVNRMTDWTEDEWHRLFVRAPLAKGDLNEPTGAAGEQVAPAATHFEAADLSDIDTKLPGMFRGREETFQKFVDEMVDHGEQQDEHGKLNADMLFRSPETGLDSGGGYAVPRSNNPNYEPPDVMSEATAGGEHAEEPLAPSETEAIQQAPGLLDNILDGLSFIFEVATDRGQEEKKIETYSEGPDEILIDHRHSGCLRPPSHQLECGSCYAFAFLALYEYLFCMQQQQPNEPTSGINSSRKLVQFSPQYLVDCGPKRDKYLKGCMGGNPISLGQFVNKYGLELEANYPYKGAQQVCPYDDHEDPSKMGYIRVEEPGLKQVKPVEFDELLKEQPILINIYPNSELKSYGGGIYNNYECEFKYAHAMLLVGQGRKDNKQYWIIRNSLGPEWGEGGYLYMSKGAALNCLVDEGTISLAKFPSIQVNPKYTKEDLDKLLPLLNQKNKREQ